MFNPEFLEKDPRGTARNTGRKTVVNEEMVVKALELSKEGYTQKSIAKAFGISLSTLARHLKAYKEQNK